MNKRLRFCAFMAAVLCGLVGQAQPVRSGYFLPGMLNRTKINPSVINKSGYVGFPFLGDISVGAATNTGVANYVFPMADGGLTTFMNSTVSAADFLRGLPSVSAMNVDLSMDLFSFGYFAGASYQTIGVTLRSATTFTAPYALFDFMKSGMSSPTTHYTIENLGFRAENFLEFSWSYARPINDQWTVGGRAKFLTGLAYLDAEISKMDITMSADEWRVSSHGRMSASAMLPFDFAVNEEGQVSGLTTGGDLGVNSFGGSIDLGATYKPADRWTVSLSAVDVGFIVWNNAVEAQTKSEQPFLFQGFTDISIDGSSSSIDEQMDEIKAQATELFSFYPTTDGFSSRTKWLKATINASGEYEIFEDLFSVGLLSSVRIDPVFTVCDFVFSANYRPTDSWFNASVSLDVSNVACSMGTVINFCPKRFNFFLGVDYMLWQRTPASIPLYGAAPRVNFGINFPLVRKAKKERVTEEL